MTQNLRIVRSPESVTVQPDGGDWMLSVGDKGACLLRKVTTVDDDGEPVDGWMDATLADALDRDDRALVEAYMAAHYPGLTIAE